MLGLSEVDLENSLCLVFIGDSYGAALDHTDQWRDSAFAWRECGE